ncbi:MAG: hypothetical protein AB7S75_21255 [Desulfococcaceae bacterium]
MYAVEFRTKIKNGIIEIPEIYKKRLKTSVKVIILGDEKTEQSPDIIDELLCSPVKIPNFKPLKRDEIYDRG